jgi:hypothetical protein
VRGYAHVIKEDTVSPNLLFAGTEFGLWISLDGGKQWAQYKGGDFPNVAVRDLVVHPRESDLVIATHGRGIWIVDDITPLRTLTPEVLAQDAVFLKAKPTQQRIEANGGWPEGAATYIGPDPPDAALITYYQKKRHIFGKMSIQVFDSNGKLVDTLPANSRRGIGRVEWPMNLKPPKVPPAASVAFAASQGPRVVPGAYTVKMVRGDQTYTEPLTVLVDPRAKYGQAERQENFDATMKVYNLLNDMSYDVAEINGVRDQLKDRAAKAAGDDALHKQLASLAGKSDEIRKKIVATKEGGAITGEERVREKTTQLYGDITNYEGRPADYQEARIGSLTRELSDVMEEFSKSITSQLEEVNKALAAKNLEPVKPLTRDEWDKENSDAGALGAATTTTRERGERD